jgi:precorrin-6A/cobalt-precorrin-6A reductase
MLGPLYVQGIPPMLVVWEVMKRVLILGGTGEAAKLAGQAAHLPGLEVITSLAGRTHRPVTPAGRVRIGGFGGEAGLIEYLREQRIDLLIDATHPFAAHISFNAARAAHICGLPYLLLIRPPWAPLEGDRWIAVESIAAAVSILPSVARRVFLTTGRQDLVAFAPLTDLWFLMRMVDPPAPDTPVPPGTLVLARGPFALEDERELLQTYAIEAIVSKNSGGDATYAKIRAARELALPVVMIQRPPRPAGKQVSDVEAALGWLARHL